METVSTLGQSDPDKTNWGNLNTKNPEFHISAFIESWHLTGKSVMNWYAYFAYLVLSKRQQIQEGMQNRHVKKGVFGLL
jgi:hypothetical protein